MISKKELESEKEFMDNRDKIVPVTFVKEEARANTDLNNLFVLPYDITSINIGTAANQIENLAKTHSGELKDQIPGFSKSLSAQINNNLFDAIRGFIVMNVKDVTAAFILKFFKEKMPTSYGDFHAVGSLHDICTKIDAYMNEAELCIGNPYLTEIYYQQIAAGLFNNIVVSIDGIIGGICSRNCIVIAPEDYDLAYDDEYDDEPGLKHRRQPNYAKTFAGEIFENSYGKGTANYKVLSDPQFNYVFTTSVIRECLEQQLPMLYGCICKIFASAAYMANSNCVTPPASLVDPNKIQNGQ